MKYIDEFRNKRIVKKLVSELYALAPQNKNINLMEVCGTHTNSFFRYGLNNLLPPAINLLSGPGCPVCVSSQDYIDKAIEYAKRKEVSIVTFGDMLRVPGTSSSLEKQRAQGADIHMVYSPLDAMTIAQQRPSRTIIFLGVGFETTIPTVALTIQHAKRNKIDNFFVLCSHKLIPPAMKILASDTRLNLDGFICPGHVSAIIGAVAYRPLARRFHTPCVIAGFEPIDMLEGIRMLVQQIINKKSTVEIQYRRVVKEQGNPAALKIISEVFKVADVAWRGLGVLPKSGLTLKKPYQRFDIEKVMPLRLASSGKKQPKSKCLCGDVLKGIIKPTQCPSFGKRCTPTSPLGPCMVSFEGSCAIYYKFGTRRTHFDR
ncbi:hydrogenase formation protein HypD [Candidatus Omnitrophota bacterium]